MCIFLYLSVCRPIYPISLFVSLSLSVQGLCLNVNYYALSAGRPEKINIYVYINIVVIVVKIYIYTHTEYTHKSYVCQVTLVAPSIVLLRQIFGSEAVVQTPAYAQVMHIHA